MLRALGGGDQRTRLVLWDWVGKLSAGWGSPEVEITCSHPYVSDDAQGYVKVTCIISTFLYSGPSKAHSVGMR